MLITILKSKIHRAVVTEAELNYVGSVTVDEDLMDAAGIYEYERVQVVNISNGSRIETYVIAGARKSGVICLNGAAARCAQKGDRVIIMAYAQTEPENIAPPKVVFVDGGNKISRVTSYEKHGELAEE